jgi:hypothetical protein
LQQPIVKSVPQETQLCQRAVFAPSPGADDNQKLFCNVVVVCGSTDILIEPGSPRENGYCERFISKLRDEFLSGEIFYSLKEVQVQLTRRITLGLIWRRPARRIKRLKDECSTITPDYANLNPPQPRLLDAPAAHASAGALMLSLTAFTVQELLTSRGIDDALLEVALPPSTNFLPRHTRPKLATVLPRLQERHDDHPAD